MKVMPKNLKYAKIHEHHDDVPVIDIDADEAVGDAADESSGFEGSARAGRQGWKSPRRLTAVLAVAIVVVLGGLVGYLGMQLHRLEHAVDQRAEFLQAARQGALNLTTIDWQHVDGAVKRILDSATGAFHDDFEKRSQPFVEVVKQAQSHTEGTVTMVGLESISGDQARALVAVTVKTSSGANPETASKAWRMRISVQKVGADVKVADVEFVP